MSNNIVFPGTLLGAATALTAGKNVHVKDALLYSAVLGASGTSQILDADGTVVSVRSAGVVVPYAGAIVIAQISRLSRKYAECNIVCIDGKPVIEGHKGVIIFMSKAVEFTTYSMKACVDARAGRNVMDTLHAPTTQFTFTSPTPLHIQVHPRNNNIHECKTIDSTIYEWFRPGDYVKAKVISIHDPKQLVLTTAQRELGVVKVEADEDMIPISWKFFLGTRSGRVEKRKVAKP